MSYILGRAGELDARGEPYALATVVAVDRPVSAKPGDRAIVMPGGVVDGWVGGSCSEPIVIREALAALGDGSSRLVRIRQPGAPNERERPGVVTEITTCASEGGLDVFVEPRLPRPRLVVVGSSPVGRKLVELAGILGYRTTGVLDDPAEELPGVDRVLDVDALRSAEIGPADAVVVATMNRYDELALEASLATEAGYIGLVASRTRAESVRKILVGRGVAESQIDRVTAPAGFDLGPSSQEEIALAIMAEAVAERHRREPASAEEAPAAVQTVPQAIDPVCGMSVAVVAGAISASYEGTTFYFCAPACREEFLQHPERHVRAAGGS
ncbi:MAG: YHS domain-containing protein [Actinobacteria bacterium]|nr:YHS domain-containing protein [Actinomycetota bacterium]